jgi:hypothetical protein
MFLIDTIFVLIPERELRTVNAAFRLNPTAAVAAANASPGYEQRFR